MKHLFLITALIVSGCAAVEEKRQTLREVGNAAINSDQKCIKYYYDNGDIEFYRAACSGSKCKEQKLDCSFE